MAQGTQLLQSGYFSHQSGAWRVSATPDVGLPVLTQRQMLEDYDTFTNIVEQVFPLREVNRQVYGQDIYEVLATNRSKIGTIARTEQFADLISRTMAACRGSHFWIGCWGTNDFVDAAALQLVDKYLACVQAANPGGKDELPLLYFRGDYYTLYDIAVGATTYPKGRQVMTCNGLTPDAIVNATVQSGRSPRWDWLDWDYDLNKYYTTHFDPFPGTNASVTIQLAQADGRILTLQLDPDKKAVWRTPRHDAQPLVSLVNADQLYIKLPTMNTNLISFYRTELAKYRGSPIRKVVVDIRNNHGGSDLTWSTVLSLLVKQKLVLPGKLGVKPSDILDRLTAHDRNSFYAAAKLEKISFLNNEAFKVIETGRTIEPDAESLNLTCKIFVLSENVYSSAGGLMNVCPGSGQLISVGLPNGQILGQGTDPVGFSLPHSKIAFSLEPALDLTGCQTAKDTQHTDVEVRITPTLEQLLDYYNTGDDMNLEERLNQHDPFFQKARELDGMSGAERGKSKIF